MDRLSLGLFQWVLIVKEVKQVLTAELTKFVTSKSAGASPNSSKIKSSSSMWLMVVGVPVLVLALLELFVHVLPAYRISRLAQNNVCALLHAKMSSWVSRVRNVAETFGVTTNSLSEGAPPNQRKIECSVRPRRFGSRHLFSNLCYKVLSQINFITFVHKAHLLSTCAIRSLTCRSRGLGIRMLLSPLTSRVGYRLLTPKKINTR